MARFLLYIISVVIIIFGIAFAILNSQAVSINFYVRTYTLPLSILLIFSIGLGFIIGLLVLLVVYTKLKLENRRIKKCIKLAEQKN